MSTIDMALGLIAKRGQLRTPAIAEALGIGENAVDAMLEPARTDGRLIVCTVNLGGRQVIEYRMSTSGGGNSPRQSFTMATPRKSAAVLLIKKEECFGTQTPTGAIEMLKPAGVDMDAIHRRAAAAQQPQREEALVSLSDRIRAALLKHGPLDARELRANGVDHPHTGNYAASMAREGVLKRLGGGAKSSIYGLPTQTIEDRKLKAVDADHEPKPVPTPKKAAKRAAPAKPAKRAVKAGSKAAKKAWKTRRAIERAVERAKAKKKPPVKVNGAAKPVASFQIAVTSLDRLLFMNAKKGDLDLGRDEMRGAVKLVRHLDEGELQELKDFVAALDGGEVAEVPA